LERPAEDVMGCLAEGKRHEQQGRFAEAAEAYRRGLDLARPNRQLRITFLSHLALALDQAGRPEEAAGWAERAIAEGARAGVLRAMHNVAGRAYSQLRRWDEAEAQLQTHRALSRDAPQTAQALAMLADVMWRRGDLAGAHAMCLEAEAAHPPAARDAWLVRANVLVLWGRFEEALALFERARETATITGPAGERRVRAMIGLGMARVEAEIGRLEDAWRHYQEGVEVVAREARLGVLCDATGAWMMALLGFAEEAGRQLGGVEARLATIDGHDRGIAFIALAAMGKAALAMDDPRRGLGYFERYLTLDPEPALRPTGLFYLGECRRRLGDEDGARRAYREAAGQGLDTYHARKAGERLRAGSLGATGVE
jgi:tetratricopeptide (TPR) repeat protein